jgi:hypothetical protein
MKISEMLAKVARNAVNLQTVTCLGEVRLIGTVQSIDVTMPDDLSKVHSMVTNVNLLEGDIVTCVSPDLLDPQYEDLRKLHQEMASRGQGIVERNVAILRGLIQEFGKDAEVPD